MIEPHSLYFWILEVAILFLGWIAMVPIALIGNFLAAVFSVDSTVKNLGLVGGYTMVYYNLSMLHFVITGQHFSFLLLTAMIIKEVTINAKDKNLTPEALKDTYNNALALIICLIAIAIKGPFSWY
jgi:hypothetical protein